MRPVEKSIVLNAVAAFALVVVTSNSAAAGSSSQVEVFGLSHVAAGQASLSRTPDGDLAVSNLGSSGQDGVAIALGEVQGFLPEVTVPSSILPPGAVLRAAASGSVDAGVMATVSLTVEGILAGSRLTPDFNGIGAPTYELRVFDSDRLVYARAGMRGSGATVTGSLSAKPKGKWCFGPFRISYQFPRSRVLLANGDEAFGDTVYFFPEKQKRSIGSYSTATLLASGLPSFTVTDETIKLSHLEHRALGGATFQAKGGALTVANLGSQGEDGVSVDLLQSESWHAVLQALDTRTLPTGAFLLASMTGSIHGIPDLPIVSLRIEDVGSQLEATFDFTPIHVSSYTVEVLLGDQVVDSQTGLQGPAARLDNVGSIFDPSQGTSSGTPTVTLGSPVPTNITITGHQPVVGDKIRAFPADNSPSVSALDLGAFSRFQLVSRGIPSFTLMNEAVVPLHFEGLEQTPLAGSTLTVIDNQLSVENGAMVSVAMPGVAGVQFHTGEADGVLWTVDLGDADVPIGAILAAKSFGQVDGVPDQPAGGLISERVAGGYRITPDFSGLGATTYELQLYRQGVLVYSQPGMSGPAATAPAGSARRYCCRVVFYSCSFGATGSDTQLVQVTNGPQVLADMMIFKHEAATRKLDFHTAILTQTTGIPKFAVAEQSVLLFGALLPHRALGSATLDAAGGRLTVSNLGSSGEDGVNVEVGHFAPADSSQVSWEPLDPAGTAPVGASLEAIEVGSFRGIPGQPLGQLHIAKGGNGTFQITADFGSADSPTVRVQIFRQGVQVANLHAQGSAVGTAAVWPVSVGKLAGTTAALVARYPAATSFGIAGGSFLGDELRILAEKSGGVDFQSDLALRAASLPALVITAEVSVPRP
jgi:hypothetical protein